MSSVLVRPYRVTLSMGIRSLPVLGAISFSMLVCAWLLTYGSWHLFGAESFGTFYDDQARSLLHRHWDVTSDSISGEAFFVNGKSYGYFGFLPALPRILLNLVVPSMYGRWSRLSMLAAVLMAAIGAVLCLAIFSEVPPRALPAALYCIVATLGSSVVFLCSRAFVYHEATLWASVLAVYAYLCFGLYLRTQSAAWLGWGCLLSGSTLFARATIGGGTLACAMLLAAGLVLQSASNASPRIDRVVGPVLRFLNFPTPLSPARHCTILIAAQTAIFFLYGYVNHAKFGTILDGAPLRYHVQMTPERLAKFDGKLFRLLNVPYELHTYLLGDQAPFRNSFPWITLVMPGKPESKYVKFDFIEPSAPIPWAIPALLGLSMVGVISLLHDHARRGFLIILLGSLVGGCIVFAFTCSSYRYEHDLYPFFIFAGSAGLTAISRWQRISLQRLAYSAVVLAALWSVCANSAFALEYQREFVWGVDANAIASYRNFRGHIDAAMSHWKAAVTAVTMLDSSASVLPFSGAGSSQAFTFTYTDPDGYQDISGSQIVINSTSSGAGGCYILFGRGSNAIALADDAGTPGPLTRLGAPTVLENSKCSVLTSTSWQSFSRNTVSFTLFLSFKPAFAGQKNVYTALSTNAGVSSGLQQVGTFTATVSTTPISTVY